LKRLISERKTFPDRLVCFLPAIIFLVNFFLRAAYLSADDVSLDEPFTLFHSQKNWHAMLEMLRTENNPPLYFLIMHWWIKIAGIGAFAARFPSLIFSSIACSAIFLTGKKFFSLRTGIIAALLCTGSTIHVFYSHDARCYELFFMLSCFSFNYFLRLTEEVTTKKDYAILLFINILLCYTHFFGIIIVLMQSICVISFKQLRNKIAQYSLVIILLIVFYSPYLSILFSRFHASSGGTWIQKPIFTDLYTMLWRFSNTPLLTVMLLGIILIAVLTKKFSGRNPQLMLCIFTFLVPYFGIFILSFKLPLFLDRYLIFLSMNYFLIASFAIDKILPQGKAGSAIAMIFPVIMISTMKLNTTKKRHTAGLVDFVKTHENDSTAIILYPSYIDLNFIYYYSQAWFKNTGSFSDSLLANKIFPINHFTDLNTSTVNSATKIFMVSTGLVTDSSGVNIIDQLKSKFPKMDENTFYENMKVFTFSR
jgi:mannosyltransferase